MSIFLSSHQPFHRLAGTPSYGRYLISFLFLQILHISIRFSFLGTYSKILIVPLNCNTATLPKLDVSMPLDSPWCNPVSLILSEKYFPLLTLSLNPVQIFCDLLIVTCHIKNIFLVNSNSPQKRLHPIRSRQGIRSARQNWCQGTAI